MPSPSPRKPLFTWPRLTLLLLLAGLMAWGGSRLYLQRRDRMLTAAATQAIDARDFPAAWAWLQRLCHARPNDVATFRLIARYDALQRSPEELACRARIIQLGPATLDDYLAWASAALGLGQNGVALQALDRVPAAWRENAAYQDLCARVSVATGQLQAADDHFAAAARLDPSNPTHAANLAALRLTAASSDNWQSARATLETLAASPSPPISALRALLDDAARQHDLARTAQFRAALRQHPARTIDDELACIATEPSAREAHADLTSLWQKAEINPIQSLQVAEWMIKRGGAAEALGWLRKITGPEQSDTAVETAEADALTALRDWPALRAYLAGKDWQACDFLRVALLVRCAHETHGSAPPWPDAIAACRGDGSDLLILAQTAAGWSWKQEAETLYWRIAEMGYPSRGPALKALWDSYGAAGNTSGMLLAARQQYNDSPTDPGARNNFAFLSLLSGIGIPEASRMAKETFLQQPGNPNIAATYAYALYLEGRYRDGLKILTDFGESRIQAAGATLYLALLQQAAGQPEAAAHSAAAVDPRKLLPEERLLLQKIESEPAQG